MNFWSHIPRRSALDFGYSFPKGGVDDVGEPEVANLGFVVLVFPVGARHEDVFELDIVMDDALAVDILQAFQDVLAVRYQLGVVPNGGVSLL